MKPGMLLVVDDDPQFQRAVSRLFQDDDLVVLPAYSIAEGVENTNYDVQTTEGRYILTLVEKRASVEEVPFYVGFMNHLRMKGIPCPAVIAQKDGGEIFFWPGVINSFGSFIQMEEPRPIFRP